jgi:Tol biopolymer transport system component
MHRVKLLAPLVLALLVVTAPSARASWPGREGPVAYLGIEVGQNRFDFEPTGLRAFTPGVPGSEVELTSDPTDSDPQVSPDGRLVVFSRTLRDPSGLLGTSIWAIGVDGSDPRQVTFESPGVSDTEPTFFPSGKSIAFARSGEGVGRGDIYSVRLDGSGLHRITETAAEDRSPAVSPRGGQIVFQCSHYRIRGIEYTRPHICSVRPDGSRRRDLTPRLGDGAPASDPDFSPSGRAIAFTVGPGTAADVFTMGANGARIGALTNRGPHGGRTFPRPGGYAQPSFSPAGGSLLAVARQPGVPPHFVRVRLRDPQHPRSLGESLLGRAPAWAPR